ncbi:hypothetical protein LMH87_011971 [Akanthomyces muscarius]|uniref:Uncharacterized protein n=1 Tax=Akanthomyces muscarius TaxID=2231603 RepID=A0A9W8QCP0_AKAMU|nr:hypothetical protein LMH87_011971 [Akanthomyces muscarius]KAJ4151260.1 hypothetical protein LMH87_011971 [Akanthomyces muscarius]
MASPPSKGGSSILEGEKKAKARNAAFNISPVAPSAASIPAAHVPRMIVEVPRARSYCSASKMTNLWH